MSDIKVKVRNVYGVERIYPVCESADIFTRLTGQKTLSRESIALIKKLGFSVSVISDNQEI